MAFTLDTSGTARLGRLLDRIERHAEKWAAETAYQYSYEPGSTRYYQANARAHKAETSFENAVAEMRALLARAVR